jgi:hypothetical protein
MNTSTLDNLYKGQRVLCRWRGTAYAFPATVLELDGDRIRVRYDNGDTEETVRAAVEVPATPDQPPHGWKPGDEVLVRRGSSIYWHPGTVEEVGEADYRVRLATGKVEQVRGDRLAPLDLRTDSEVQARPPEGKLYYPAKVVRRDGDQLTIHYDHGDEEPASLASIRVVREELVDRPRLPEPEKRTWAELPLVESGLSPDSLPATQQLVCVEHFAPTSDAAPDEHHHALLPAVTDQTDKSAPTPGADHGHRLLRTVLPVAVAALLGLGVAYTFHAFILDRPELPSGANPAPPPGQTGNDDGGGFFSYDGSSVSFEAAIVIDWLSRQRAQELPPQANALDVAFQLPRGCPGGLYARAVAWDIRGQALLCRETLATVPEDDPWYGLAQAELKAEGDAGPTALVRWYADLQKRLAGLRNDDRKHRTFLLAQDSAGRKAAVSLGRTNQRFVASLLPLAREKDEYLLQAVAAILAEIGPGAPEAVPALTPLVRHESAAVRWQAVNALGQIGPAAREALPALETAAKDRDKAVRARAQKALLQVF